MLKKKIFPENWKKSKTSQTNCCETKGVISVEKFQESWNQLEKDLVSFMFGLLICANSVCMCFTHICLTKISWLLPNMEKKITALLNWLLTFWKIYSRKLKNSLVRQQVKFNVFHLMAAKNSLKHSTGSPKTVENFLSQNITEPKI